MTSTGEAPAASGIHPEGMRPRRAGPVRLGVSGRQHGDLLLSSQPEGSVIVTATLMALMPIAVDPVPWARAQMAFTLAFHIILVPLGVSWAFMTLIANYRGLRRNDRDALVLAQRWSKYMAVTFAVGAVTGTVLSFEFGLLWPRFMGQWGEAFGVPFAFEGLFFFTEAIFIAVYLFGWRRLKPGHISGPAYRSCWPASSAASRW